MPGANLTRFHGVFAPNSQYRAQIIKRPDESKASEQEVRTESEKRAAMIWAQRLKRAFSIDIEICEVCGGKAKAIACIVDPVVINKILKHLNPRLFQAIKWYYLPNERHRFSTDSNYKKHISPPQNIWRDKLRPDVMNSAKNKQKKGF